MKKAIGFVVIVVIITTNALAQSNKSYISFSPGIVSPINPREFQKYWNPGYYLSLGYERSLRNTSNLYGFYFGYGQLEVNKNAFEENNCDYSTSENTSLFTISSSYQKYLLQNVNDLNLYLITSVTITQLLRGTVSYSNRTTYAHETINSVSVSTFNISAGIGANFLISEDIHAFVQGIFMIGVTGKSPPQYTFFSIGIKRRIR